MKKENSMDTLLPCPFCGGEAHAVKISSHHAPFRLSENWQVLCSECRIQTDEGYDNPQNAIKVWNTRCKENSLTFGTYQQESKRTAIYPSVGNNYMYPVLGLVGEAGEVANLIKKIQRDAGGILTQEHKGRVKKELGDIVWYVSQIATELGLQFEDIASENLKKLFSRMERGTLQGSGDDR